MTPMSRECQPCGYLHTALCMAVAPCNSTNSMIDRLDDEWDMCPVVGRTVGVAAVCPAVCSHDCAMLSRR